MYFVFKSGISANNLMQDEKVGLACVGNRKGATGVCDGSVLVFVKYDANSSVSRSLCML
jgi:hypothetical protein